MAEPVIRFLKSSDFYKGFVLTLAILLVMLISFLLEQTQIGLSIALGVFICAPADVVGSIRHRIIGIFSATVLGVIATIIINLGATHQWLLTPVLFILVFSIAYISVYGFRASLVSFSGLLAIILSFAHPQTGTDIFVHAGLMGLGGVWYLLLSHFSHLLIHKRHTEQLIAECMELTAKYMKSRAELSLKADDHKLLEQQLFHLETEINVNHEQLREILLSSRQSFGQSNFSRRQVLILIELIDFYEIAIANLSNFNKIQELFKDHPERLRPLINVIFEMAEQLKYLSEVIRNNKKFVHQSTIEDLLQRAEEEIATFIKEENISAVAEDAVLLQNLHQYLEKQAQKIEIIRRVMENLFEKDQVRLRPRDSEKFITHQDYDWKTFTENLSFSSPIFKHSLRLAVTVLVGYAIGLIFSLQNAYWILLTIIVIMRPGYSLTKERSKHRIYGTLIGASIAVGVVLLTQNPYIYGVLAVITFMLAFALVQKNYKSSAMFITLSVIFIYALVQPHPLNVIQFRVLDTLAGAALAIIANTFLWPSWEFQSIQKFIGEALEANRIYLEEINNYYHHKNNVDPAYKLSRKRAFLAIGNLNAAFQRMTQEPKSRQKDLAKMYELVVLNHTFLSVAASLGTFIHQHKTTAASNHFENYIASISGNLKAASEILQENGPAEASVQEVTEAREYLNTKFQQLMNKYTRTISEGNGKNLKTPLELQEVKHISDQLKWLYTISENLKNVLMTIYKMSNRIS